MKVTGILSISNATHLAYPFPVVIRSLHEMCDNVIVGVDPSFPEDVDTIEKLGLDNLTIVLSVWNFNNRNGGTEIAIQMDILLDEAKESGSDWVVVAQADELFHEKDTKILRAFMERNLDTRVNGFSTERLYFWKDIQTVREDWQESLVRIFKPGCYSFMAEGTDKSGMFSARIVPGDEKALPYKMYHYSRVDSPDVISRRVRNLDGLFHEDKTLIPTEELPDYDFVTREYDNYSTQEKPKEVAEKLSKFTGTHPKGVEDWYND